MKKRENVIDKYKRSEKTVLIDGSKNSTFRSSFSDI